MEGFESFNKYIHSGDLEELDDFVPYEDFTDYTAEDFIEDHATATIGDEEDSLEDPETVEIDDGEDSEPSSKRFRGDFDSFDQEGSNDYDSRYGGNAPGIPSLLNLHLAPPRHGQAEKKAPENSPTRESPWESANYNNGSFGSNQNANNKPPPSNKDRREGRRQSSRWSSTRR